MDYKPSKFNVTFFVDQDITGVYNTSSRSLIGMSSEEVNALKSGGTTLSEEAKKICLENGFLVPMATNENKLLDQVRTEGLLHNKVAIYRILPTTACNARCFYCYEDHQQSISMDQATARQTVKFIQACSNNMPVHIQWFGGEPLLNLGVIDYLTQLLQQQRENHNLEFSIITNGSLLDTSIIKKMKFDWDISDIQITLDGTAQEYAKRKRYIKLSNPFDVVLRNISMAVESGLRTTIRLNYDFENYRDILQLIGQLGKVLPHTKNMRIYAYHLFEARPQSNKDEAHEEEWFAIQDALISQGFTTPKQSFSLPLKRTRCFACQTKGFVVMPDGTLFKCPMAINDPSAKVGDVWHGVTNSDIMARWCNTEIEPQCQDCALLPTCQGGCRAGELGYSSERCILQKDFAEKILLRRYIHLTHPEG